MTQVSEIRFEGVCRRFVTPRRPPVEALREVDLTVPAGEITCVVGPSGCGKTTLIRLAAGLDQPDAGQVLIGNSPPRKGGVGAARGDGASASVDNSPPRKGGVGAARGDGASASVGMLAQEGRLLPWRRVLQNVALGLEIRGVRRRERRRRALETIRRVHLPDEIQDSYPHELSGGMRQRVALAQALCPEPGVLLMDEPFAAVDELTRQRLQEEVLSLWSARPMTVLLVTHNVEEAVVMADQVVVMSFACLTARFHVDLPRPRDRFSPPFVDMLRRVRAALAGQGHAPLPG